MDLKSLDVSSRGASSSHFQPHVLFDGIVTITQLNCHNREPLLGVVRARHCSKAAAVEAGTATSILLLATIGMTPSLL